MIREFEALCGDVEGGGISVSGISSPPVHHLDGLGLSSSPGRGAVELEAQFAVDIQHPVGTHELHIGKHVTSQCDNIIYFVFFYIYNLIIIFITY